MIIAEDSTDRIGITRPVKKAGLGFHFKWNMGWMNDTLRYIAKDPIHRQWHHKLMNFGLMYAWNERYILPLSHDEVVHGKATLLGRMPDTGTDDWQRFAGLRAYYGFMWGHPGRKLLFMGQEFAQWREWSEERELDWWLLQYSRHQGMAAWVASLNMLYRFEAALQSDDTPKGFKWLDADDTQGSTFMWLRMAPKARQFAVLCNFTPFEREKVLRLPSTKSWELVLNSDDERFGGSGMPPRLSRGRRGITKVLLPPLSAIFLASKGTDGGFVNAGV